MRDDLGPKRADLRPKKTDFRPKRVDSGSKWNDFRPLGVDSRFPAGLRPQAFLRVVADRQTNRCIKLHPCVIFEAAGQTT